METTRLLGDGLRGDLVGCLDDHWPSSRDHDDYDDYYGDPDDPDDDDGYLVSCVDDQLITLLDERW